MRHAAAPLTPVNQPVNHPHNREEPAMPKPITTTVDQPAADRLRRRAGRIIATIDATAPALVAAIRAAKLDVRRIGEAKRLSTDAKLADRRAGEAQLQARIDELATQALEAVQEVERLAGDATATES